MTLEHLIGADLVRLPFGLEHRYRGVELKAPIENASRIAFDGVTYDSLSTAGGVARNSVAGPLPGRDILQTNGWTFWSVVQTGDSSPWTTFAGSSTNARSSTCPVTDSRANRRTAGSDEPGRTRLRFRHHGGMVIMVAGRAHLCLKASSPRLLQSRSQGRALDSTALDLGITIPHEPDDGAEKRARASRRECIDGHRSSGG